MKFALRTMKFYQHESCGWCIPCREGTDWLKKTLIRFHAGGGMKKDIDNMQYLAENMLGRTFCPLGDAAAMPTIAFVKKFRKEFEDHLDGKPCPYEKEGVVEQLPVHGVAPASRRPDLRANARRSWIADGCEGVTPSHSRRDAGATNSMADVTLTVDGKKITAPAGTLLIEACKSVGIEVPSFCYYPNLSLQGACRMCLVKVEKMPKLQTACTTVISEGMIVTTDSDEIKQARKSMLEMLLGQPSAGLPGVRRGRRVRTAGHDVLLRRRRIEIHGGEEPQGRAAVVSGGVLRPAALHSVLPLRARVRRGHGRVGAGRAEPRREFAHRAQ